jgi:hypothetical protein
MRFRELDEVVRSIDRLLPSCGEESVCGRQLRKLRRELVDWQKKGGPVPKGTMLRIVADICTVVSDGFVAQQLDERK